MATSALSRMMKKAASSVIPLANRRTPLRRNYTSAILSRQEFRTTSIPNHHYHQFSAVAEKKSNSDDTFLRVIESEINHSAEHEVAELPRDFPFRIEDNPEEGILILTREYEGEMIEVRVRTCLSAEYVNMEVSVSKESGVTLEFEITVASVDNYWSMQADRIEINSLAIKNQNDPDDFAPPSWELDHSVKTALYTYLEVRGIEPSINKFLYEYYKSMVKKKHKKNTALLKNLKTFIAK